MVLRLKALGPAAVTWGPEHWKTSLPECTPPLPFRSDDERCGLSTGLQCLEVPFSQHSDKAMAAG